MKWKNSWAEMRLVVWPDKLVSGICLPADGWNLETLNLDFETWNLI